jgi:hypothetical protein
MIVRIRPETAAFADSTLTPRMRAVLDQLATARGYALRMHADAWDFAVELTGLLAAGAMAADLRWLLAHGYLDLAMEISRPGDPVRRFHPVRHLAFTARTCFVLTDAGMGFLNAHAVDGAAGTEDSSAAESCTYRSASGKLAAVVRADALPHWDAMAQVLCFAGLVVKRFGYSSPNQEAVLEAFEEEHWPRRIDDPLRPLSGVDSKQRLRDTIRTLNAKQENLLIRFRSGGTGEHVIWEPAGARLACPSLARVELRRAA